MDPYLESHWDDLQTRLAAYIADELHAQLADDLLARIETAVQGQDVKQVWQGRPDVRVVEVVRLLPGEISAPAPAVVSEPVVLKPFDASRKNSIIAYYYPGNRIITVIEILSPADKKPGPGLSAYLEKRAKYIHAQFNLVEIDLIRAGDWTTMVGQFPVDAGQRTPYRVTISEAGSSNLLHHPIALGSKLPTISIPLRSQDALAVLDLQALLDKSYATGRYDRIDYTQPCDPPLTGTDAEWAQKLISEHSPR